MNNRFYMSNRNAEAGVSGSYKLPSSDRTDGCKPLLWPEKMSINSWKHIKAINKKLNGKKTEM